MFRSDYRYDMPCVVRDKAERNGKRRSPFWYACYTDPAGKRLKKSTGLTAKSKALEMACTLQKASDEARRGALTEARTRELLSEVLQGVNGEGLRVFTVEEWFDHFVKQKRKSRADKTAARHEQMMREFIEFLGHRARLNIAAVTSRDIADFRDHRHSLGLAPATVNLDVTIISSAFNAAWKQGHVSVNPCAAVEPLKDRPHRKSTFTPEQVSAIVKTAEGDWKGLILVAFYTGARLGDCANLRWRDIDLVSVIKTIRFQPSKGGGEVVTVIHPALEDYLLSLPTPKSDEAFLFPSLAQRNVSPLSKAFRQIMEAARIEQRIIRERSKSGSGRSVNALSFHSLRHSFSSILANAGVSEELRMALTGHTTREVHRGYTHHELERLRDAVAVLPSIVVPMLQRDCRKDSERNRRDQSAASGDQQGESRRKSASDAPAGRVDRTHAGAQIQGQQAAAHPMSKPRQKKEDHAAEIVVGLTFIHEKVKAELATFEAERAENRNKVERLRAAELAAPRKRRIYFRMARLLRAGVGSEIVGAFLTTPERLHKTAEALRAEESDVDRGGLKILNAFLAARRLHGKKLKLEHIVAQYGEQNPGHRVPQPRSISRTLRRKELWNFKRGRPPEKGDKPA